MLVNTNALILSKIRYGDNDLIVKCYTNEYGVLNFILKNILKSKKSQFKKSYFQELSNLQIEINYNENRDLQLIRNVKSVRGYSSLHTNILKSSVVLFLSEILSNILREQEKNEALYAYLESSLLWFDEEPGAPNFHVLFLLKLTKYLGFYPSTMNMDGEYFNLEDGKFSSSTENKHNITGDNLQLFKQLLGTTFDELKLIKMNSKQRQSFLNFILLYYRIHLGNFKQPKSLHILNQVFN